MNKRRIIIVGGGASGLMAARLLSDQFQVILIEYRNVVGGRIRSVPLNDGEGVLEAGAEFVHGDLAETIGLLKEAGLDYVKVEGQMLRREGGKWKKQEEMIEHWDKLVELMKNQDPDLTMQEFLERHFPGDEYEEFRKHIGQFVMGFDVAEPSRVSVKSLFKEWEAEEDNYRIKEGYSAMIKFLENECIKKGCRIITGQAVTQVDWQKGKVAAHTSTGDCLEAEKIVVTVPVSILKKEMGTCSIAFNPSINNYITASLQIGFGPVIKIILECGDVFWPKHAGFFLSDEPIPTWWTQHPISNNLLTGWAGGPMAERIAHHTNEELLELAIASVCRLFDLEQAELRNNVRQSFVFNWKNYEETGGAYSYATPASSDARRLLNTPIEETIFFAGEGLYDGKFAGTVEAALVSGRDAAEKVLRS